MDRKNEKMKDLSRIIDLTGTNIECAVLKGWVSEIKDKDGKVTTTDGEKIQDCEAGGKLVLQEAKAKEVVLFITKEGKTKRISLSRQSIMLINKAIEEMEKEVHEPDKIDY